MIAASLLASTSRNAGGLFESVRRLHQKLLQMPGISVPVFGLEDRFSVQDNPRWLPLKVDTSRVIGPLFFGYAPDILAKLMAANIDVLLVHGIWQYPSVAARTWHRRTKNPYIVSPHGMLDPWAVRNSHWKKVLAHAFYEGSHLRHASCIRALCESEAQAIRTYGLKNPICVIPNGIDLPEDGGQRTEDGGQRKMLLFLGRLHPKKGLVNALRAWHLHLQSTIRDPRSCEWQFVIAGWDQGGHEAELKRLCDELGLGYANVPASDLCPLTSDLRPPTSDLRPLSSDLCPPASVIFTGPAFGEQKDQLLRQASAFILPSFSEGLPMSVLEAWAYKLPVLMTDHCNLPEGFAADAALRIGTDVASIAEGMRLLLQSPIHDLQSLGRNGRALVERQFTWPQIAAQMKDVYEWVLGGDAPDCVRRF
ncbi:MAG: glycosyltransferase [Verrucomicrobiota bacterium]